jgi:hypothetical protein
MAINPEYEKPVQHQPNVAHDPLGQKSTVRGVPVELHGKTVDDATGLPKSDEELAKQERRAREIQPAEGDQAAEGAEPGLPKYQCHKEVWALKLKDVVLPDPASGAGRLIPEDDARTPIEVPPEFMAKHEPVAGGYYVIYKDGYCSFSPADAFEEGYTLLSPNEKEKTDANLDS